MAARLQAGKNQADLMETLLQLAVVPNKGTTAKDLTDYASAALSPDAASAANAGGIASDFLSDPSKAPDLACAQADDYKTNFVLK